MKTEFNKAQKIIVDNDHTGQRLDNFLLNFLKGIPKSKIYSIIRKGEVRVNSLRKKAFYKIAKDDLIRIWILKIFKPQLDEPEHPPVSIRNKNRSVVNDPQILKS